MNASDKITSVGPQRRIAILGTAWIAVAVLLLLGAPAFAQVYTGSLTGVVTDPSGAVIPSAKVVVTDSAKGIAYSAVTDGTGRFLVRPLPPSTYSVAVEAVGFKTHQQDGVILAVSQSASLDVSLAVGTGTESVEVSTTVAALATQDAVTGQELNRTFINDLPLLGRGVFELAGLAPGVTQVQGGFSMVGQSNNFISNGSRNATADVLLDGVSTTGYEANGGILMPLYTPSVDAVQEFKVQQSNFSADIGFSGSTVMNVVLRSGTNDIHGNAYWFVRNNILTANDWYGNAYGNKLAARRYNMFGGTVGGPIRKDRTFYFFAFEGLRDVVPKTFRAGVPSGPMRKGDFGEICGAGFSPEGRCLDPEGQLWDPYTGVYNPEYGIPIRTGFIPFNNMGTYMSPSSRLPRRAGNLIDPVAAKLINYFPMPNVRVGQPGYNRRDNWIAGGSERLGGEQWDIKVDHSFNENSRSSAKFSRLDGGGKGTNVYGNAFNPTPVGPFISRTHLFAFNHNQALTPRTLLTLSLGVTRYLQDLKDIAESSNVDAIKELGLPDYMRRSGFNSSPSVFIINYLSPTGWYNNIGSHAWLKIINSAETYDLNGNISRMQGRHDFKIGAQARARRVHHVQPGMPAGFFVFLNSSTSQYHVAGGGGDEMASFLTGIQLSGGYNIAAFASTQNMAYAGYFQDNWRVTDRLTLNLGLRWDAEMPRTERFNRQSFIDIDYPSPLKVSGFPNLKGALRFVDGNNRSPYGTDNNNIGPRFGFAYKFTDKFVARGGYGLFYAPTVRGAAGAGSGTQGFSRWSDTIASLDGATPYSTMRDPFPVTGPPLPQGSSEGALSFVGDAITGPMRGLVDPTPYEQTWSLGVQREMPLGFIVDANYVGKKGTKLYFGGTGQFNVFGPEIERMSAEQLQGLNTYVNNPFFGVVPSNTPIGSSPVIPQWRLNLPYPQFTGIGTVPLPVGNSMYHALQVKAERRFSKGLQVLATYTAARSEDDSSVGPVVWLGGFASLQNPNNRGLERSVSTFDIPHVFGVSYVYDLPFGRGQAIGSNWHPVLNAILGGWKTNGIWRFSSGQPLALSLDSGQALPTYGNQRPNLTGTLKRSAASNWREKYFANPEVAVAPKPFTVGNAPRTLSSVRSPGINNANLSVVKSFGLGFREGARAEFRAESFNAFNHPQFCGPVSSIDSALFGQVLSTCGSPREVQMGLKLYW